MLQDIPINAISSDTHKYTVASLTTVTPELRADPVLRPVNFVLVNHSLFCLAILVHALRPVLKYCSPK